MTEVLCVLLGAFLAIITEVIFGTFSNIRVRKHNARLLYYDVLSIMKYITRYKVDEKGMVPNIRYNSEWQNILLELNFLNPNQIVRIYNFYDAAYNYDCVFGKECADEYFKKLEKIAMSEEFIQLMDVIKCKANIKT